jgi:hypothetical protein
MSLDFRVTDIKDYERITKDDAGDWRPVTTALVFMTMGVGMPRITEKNADEFYARVSIMEAINGAVLRGPDGDVFLKREDVRAHIGLGTNAQTWTRPQFIKTKVTRELDDRKSYYSRWAERARKQEAETVEA